MTKPTVYSSPTCQFCTMVKAFFKENDVEFEEKDVSSDPKILEEMVQKSGQMGVPVTVIGEDVVVGFDKKTLQELIEKNK